MHDDDEWPYPHGSVWDDFGDLDDPFVPRDPDTGDPLRDDDDDDDDVDLPPVRPPRRRRPHARRWWRRRR